MASTLRSAGTGWGCILGALIAVAASAPRAQQPPHMSGGWFAPPAFVLPLPWNDPNRVPVVELPAREFGNRSLVPARTRRLGFEPRIGLTGEYTDNVFFTPTDRVGDFVAVASPGLNFRAENDRSSLEGDYSLEGAAYADQSQLTKAVVTQTGFLFWNFASSSTTRVVVAENFHRFQDPIGQLGPRPQRGRSSTTTVNDFDAQATSHVSPKVDLRVRLGSVVQRFEDPAAIDNSQTDLEAGALVLTGVRNRAGLKYRHRAVDFRGAPDAWTGTLAIEDEFSFSPLVTLRGVVGSAAIGGAKARRRTVFGAALVATTREVLWGLSYDQDVRATGGLDALFFGRTATASARWRLASRCYIDGGVSFSTYRSLETDGLQIKVWEPRLTLTYNVKPAIVVAARYVHTRQDPNVGAGTRASRIGITLVSSF
jgi:hypothetical protein